MPKLKDANLWDSYVKDVTPLGRPDTTPRPPLLMTEQIQDSTQLDLHGMTLNEAYAATSSYLERAQAAHKTVTVITGLGGKIKHEFPFWMENHESVSRIKALNGGGAYMIYFRKKD